MYRLLLLLLLALAMLTSYAVADDWEDETNVIRADIAQAADGAAASVHDTRPARTAAPAERATMGSFLGAGEQFNESGVPDISGAAPSNDGGHATSWADGPAAQNDGDTELSVGEAGHQGYLTDNVFGPMWGVPEEAQGLDEFRTARTEFQSGHRHVQRDDTQAGSDSAAGDESDGASGDGRGLEKHSINRGDPNDW